MRLSNILGWVFLIGSILHFLFSWGDEVVPWAMLIIAKLFWIYAAIEGVNEKLNILLSQRSL